jgi:L-methionine (R)-S-oxide reductase
VAAAAVAVAPSVERLGRADIAQRTAEFVGEARGSHAIARAEADWVPRVDLAAIIARTPTRLPLVDAASLASFRVPRVSEDGSCSLPDDLQPEPFQLLATLFGEQLPAPPAYAGAGVEAVEEVALSPALRRLWVLQTAMAALAAATGAQWVGVYRRTANPVGEAAGGGPGGYEVLAKEAYVGAPSRPFFPLTPEFASHSNNSTVGLSGEAVLIHDTRRMGDTPYYTCDGKVRAELCAPIYAGGIPPELPSGDVSAANVDSAPSSGVIGILDAEAFAPRHFTRRRVGAVLDLCAQLGAAGLLVDMLVP